MKKITFLLSFVFLFSLFASSQELAIDENFQKTQAELETVGWQFTAATFSSGGVTLDKKANGGKAITPTVNSPSEIIVSTKNSGSTNRSIEISYLNTESAWTVLGTYTITTKTEETFSFEMPEIVESTQFQILSNGSNAVVITNVKVYGEKAISSEAEILGFSLPSQIGAEVIDTNAATISIKMSLSANLNLAPSFFILSNAATVSPNQDQVMDFSTPKQYTVTAEDGTTTKVWTVLVEKIASSENEIKAFKLSNDQLGSSTINIGAGTISLKMPNTTDVSNLTPILFELSAGASVTPSVSAAQNFGATITYVVKAEDNSEKTWTITTNLIDPNDYKAIDFNKIVGWASAKGGPAVATSKPSSNVEIMTTTGGSGGDILYFTPDKFGDLCTLLYNRITYKSYSSNPLTIVLEPGVYDGNGVTGDGAKTFSNNMLTLQEQGDLTIVGKGKVQCKFGINVKRGYNIIIRNIYFWGYSDDAINVGEKETHHVWIDHCTAGAASQSQIPTNKDAVDGTFEVKNGASFVTVSWCVVQNHWKSCLIGHSDNNGGTDEGRLKVTHYANYYNNTYSRHPRVRFGQVHVLNCMYENAGWGRESSYKPATQIGLGYGSAASNSSEVVIENNFFYDVQFPFYADRSTADFRTTFGFSQSSTGNKPSKGLRQSGNEYDDSGLTLNLEASKSVLAAALNDSKKSIKFDELNPDAIFKPSDFYSYTALPASKVRELIPAYAGAGVLSWEELVRGISGLNNMEKEQGNLNVYANQHTISISGAKTGSQINIYNISGGLIYKAMITNSNQEFSHNLSTGFYIVKVGNESKKVIVK